MTPKILRRGYALQTLIYHLDDAAMAEVTDHEIQPGLTVRHYRPEGAAVPAPALIYFHGGGGVIGDLESHDTLCRRVAQNARIAVLAVDYRLGPEHRVPAQAEDAIAALNWAKSNAGQLNIDQARIGVGGDSAGGLISFVLATQALAPTLPGARPDMPAFLWTFYPAVDRRLVTPSMEEFTKGLLLTTPLMDWFGAQTSDDGRGMADPLVSPAAAETTGFPPTFILTVGFDPLRDEGIAMAERLRGEGTTVIHHHHPRLLHEFISMGGVVPEAKIAVDKAIDALASMSRTAGGQ